MGTVASIYNHLHQERIGNVDVTAWKAGKRGGSGCC
jgi:hypothetical protein